MSTYQEVATQVQEGMSDSTASMTYANEGIEEFQKGVDQVALTRGCVEAALGSLLTARDKLVRAEEHYTAAEDKAVDAHGKIQGAFQGAVNAAQYTDPAVGALKANVDGFEGMKGRSADYNRDKIGDAMDAARALIGLLDEVKAFGDVTLRDAQHIENASPAGIELTKEALGHLQA